MVGSMRPVSGDPPADPSSERPLRAGDWVEVRSLAEIRATLDGEGRRNGFLFMPEMVPFCGRRFQVSKRAEKTCYGSRFLRVGDAVHLAGARCNGSAHDGCELQCLTFWREEWLRRVDGPQEVGSRPAAAPAGPSAGTGSPVGTNRSTALPTRVDPPGDGTVFICQATALRDVTHEPVGPWNPRPYFHEIHVGNAGWTEAKQLIRWSLAWGRLRVFKAFSRQRSTPKVPRERIDVGDWVEVRPVPEILATLTKSGKNRGLRLSEDMLTFCGERFRVERSVTHFIDETTGRMKVMQSPCLVLESATCRGFNILCPRAQFHFWRPEWLRRLDGSGGAPPPDSPAGDPPPRT